MWRRHGGGPRAAGHGGAGGCGKVRSNVVHDALLWWEAVQRRWVSSALVNMVEQVGLSGPDRDRLGATVAGRWCNVKQDDQSSRLAGSFFQPHVA